jgi:ribokinase
VDGELPTDTGRAGGPAAGRARVGVIGHVEWVDFAVVDAVPAPGAIVPAVEHFAEAAGGGGVAAVQLRRLAGAAAFFTALGDDATGARVGRELRERHGIEVHAAPRPGPHPRAFTHLDARHERTITVLGEPAAPALDDPLPWDRCAQLDGIYVTAADAGALRAARAARVLVATPRAGAALADAGVRLDVLVASAGDAGERRAAERARPAPRLTLLTDGARGGSWAAADGAEGAWGAAPLPGPPVDAYGCGDTFAAALTLALAAGRPLEAALALAARCGARCLTGRGPYGAALEPV